VSAAAPSAHSHPHTDSTAVRLWRRGRLKAALFLTAGVLLVEFAGGLWTGSLALLADAAHMFTDVAALTLAWAGMALSDRAPTSRHTFGLARAEVLAAFINAQLLLVAGASILWEAWRRFRAPNAVETSWMLVVAVVGLIVNVIAIGLLRGARGESLNMKAAYLEVLTDALGSLGVLISAAVMARTGWWRLDALVSAAIALLVLPRAVSILREAAHILLEGTPASIDVAALRDRILGVPGVEAVHDLHFWTLSSGLHSASLHIRAAGGAGREGILAAVQRVLVEGAGVEHCTVQVEEGENPACRSAAHHV
jgi:cobalt-zinc-cadmium efflux system protein